MNNRASQRLRHTVDAIRVVAKKPESYERLWQCYQRSYLSDTDLLKAAGALDGEPRAINGVTEPLSVAQIKDALLMPQTIGLEVPSSSGEHALGFVIARYATQELRSRRAFRDYLFRQALCGQTPRFENSQAESAMENALEMGNIMCSVEFVAHGNSTVAVALLIAACRQVVAGQMRTDNARVVGKCLEAVTIGPHQNKQGNVGVRTLVEGVHLRKVASVNETRRLTTPAFTSAQLQFGLYLGDCARLRQAAARWGTPITDSEPYSTVSAWH